MEVVDRSNKPPVWDNLERISRAVYVKENTAVGETVTTVRARSADYYSRSKSVFFLRRLQTKTHCFKTIYFVRKNSCLVTFFVSCLVTFLSAAICLHFCQLSVYILSAVC